MKLGGKRQTISVLTPTLPERLPFLRQLADALGRQTNPPDEWVIFLSRADRDPSGGSKIRQIVAQFPGKIVFRHAPSTVPIGHVRNELISAASGDLMINCDDDDYYPPTRIEHVAERMNMAQAHLAGCSTSLLYDPFFGFYQAGPYGDRHSLANAMAFTRIYAENNRFEESAWYAEETGFTKGFQNSMVQLDPRHTLVQGVHTRNTFSKRKLIFESFFNENRVKPWGQEAYLPEHYKTLLASVVRESEIRRWGRGQIEQAIFAGPAEFSQELLANQYFLAKAGLCDRSPIIVFDASSGCPQAKLGSVRHLEWTSIPLTCRFSRLVLYGKAGCIPFTSRNEKINASALVELQPEFAGLKESPSP